MHIELEAWEQNLKLKPKASLHKGGGLRLGPPHLWGSVMEAGFRFEFGFLFLSIYLDMLYLLVVNPAKIATIRDHTKTIRDMKRQLIDIKGH